MPLPYAKTLKTSSLQGLSLFLHLSVISFCFYLFCYTAVQIVDIQKYTLQRIGFSKKQLHFSGKNSKKLLKIADSQKSSLQKSESIQKQLKYTLQKSAYSKIYLRYTMNILKSSLDILKYTRITSKAVITYYTNLFLAMYSVCFTAFLNLFINNNKI